MTHAARALRGGAWLLVGSVAVRGLQLGKGVILARLFTPDDFGGLATLVLLQGLLMSVVEAGLQNYIVAADDEERAMAGAFRYAILGSVLAFAAALIAAPVAVTTGHESLGVGIGIMALAVVAAPLSLAGASMDREYQFGRAKVPDILDVVFATAVAAALSRFTSGEMALVIGHVAGVWARGLLVWSLAPRRPRWGAGRGELRSVAMFCAPLALGAIASYIAEAADDWFVRTWWGEEALGSYTLAFWLPGFLLSFVALTSRVLLPYLRDQRRDREQLARTFAETNHLAAIVSAPAGIALAVFGEPLILSLYGEEWRGAVPVLRLFAISFVLRGTTGINWSLLAILDGNTRYLSFVSWATMVFAIVVGGPLIWWLGPEGGGWYNIIQLGVMGPIVRFPIILRATGSLRYLLSVWRPLLVAAVLGGLVALVPSHNIMLLVAGVSAYASAYVACILIVDPAARGLLSRLRRSLRSVS